ncbi:tetratricopeptide repeat protein [Mesobacillus zeae]|uniref:Tetratricopeptide repeat protein n=1 Tax=Mesobacillus zeae TaxID=1917180 RepID=A0A398B4X5_9BACI|nr:tetratricopeptide repeat protein [Mesobacillus zeae]RID84965.1 tetratricopeptide repeat protein [Mesobacillus zeae]
MGKDFKAIKQTGQLLSFVPTGEYYFAKGIKAYNRRDLQRAHKYFSRAMDLEPGEPMIVCQLAIVNTELGDYQQSIRLLRLILEEYDEEMTECHYFLSNNYAHMGLFKDAYNQANLYLKFNPDGEFADDAEDLLELITLEADEFDEDLFEEDELIVKQDEARRLLEAGEFLKAVEVFEDLIKEFPEYWSAYNNLALAYFYLGETEKADGILEQVLEMNPGNLHALCNKLVFAFYRNEPEKMERLTTTLSKIHPLTGEQQFKLGATFSLIGEWEHGYKWLKRLQRFGHEGDGAFYYWLSYSAFHTGREQASRTYWKKVLELNPEREGHEPWSERNHGQSLDHQVSSIINRLDSEYPEERLFALFLASVSAKKEEVLSSEKIGSSMSSLEKQYLHYVESGNRKPGMEEVLGAHETALQLYEFHQPINHDKAGVYLIWFAVFQEAVNEGRSLKNKKAWAAAVDYVWGRLRDDKSTKQAVAQKYEISVSTLSKYVRMVNGFLR